MLTKKAYSTKAAKIGYVRQTDIDEERYNELIMKMAKTNEYIARADVATVYTDYHDGQLYHFRNNTTGEKWMLL